jgi:hypothetical protein
VGDRAPSLAQVLGSAMAAGLAERRTATVGRIVRYDAAKQQADVQPLIRQAYLDEAEGRQVEQLPVVPSVPVLCLGGGGYRLTFPIRAGATDGDTCLLVFADASLDKWLAGTGAEVDPEVDEPSLADAVAIVGVRPFGAPLASHPTTEATIGKDDGPQIHLDSSLITIGDLAGAQFIALANLVLSELQAIQAQLTAHTHTGVQPGAGVTGASSSTYVAGAVAATQAKAK